MIERYELVWIRATDPSFGKAASMNLKSPDGLQSPRSKSGQVFPQGVQGCPSGCSGVLRVADSPSPKHLHSDCVNHASLVGNTFSMSSSSSTISNSLHLFP